jgi:amino acid transporter
LASDLPLLFPIIIPKLSILDEFMSLPAVRSDGGDSTRPKNGVAAMWDRSRSAPPRVLILSSVMLTFIGLWSTAAVVLCDLASTAYYIGGVVESQIGKAAPWFILAVMVFSYGVRSIYIESCAMFVRGGVYRVVKEAMGHGMAKVSVSALLFDYVLTGPISAVSAGHYLVRLFNSLLGHFQIHKVVVESWGAAGVAIAVVLYFFQSNLRGIRSSSSKALKIMWATTAMAAVMLIWCLATLAIRPETRTLPPWRPDLSKKATADGKPVINVVTGKQEDPLGWIAATPIAEELRPGHVNWLSMIGALGIVVAFGHSILAMSGEETLAQVYREVKAPKLTNFKWAAFIVFVYSLAITGLMSFFAVMIIPDGARSRFQDNLISGLAMNVVGPEWAKLGLNTMVVIVGFLILAGAVNTSIVGANGVLNRVTEDGLLPTWFQRPQKTFGTTWRLLTVIAGLQILTIVISGGDVILLGEAYAFGVVWSLTLKSLSMVMLRFRKPDLFREYRVPINVPLGRRELPVGLILIFLVLLAAALANLLTKTVATMSGVAFTAILLAVFTVTEWFRKRSDGEDRQSSTHKNLEQFKLKPADELSRGTLGLDRRYCKLVWLNAGDDLAALETCLVETDTDTTDILVVAAHPAHAVEANAGSEDTDVVEDSGQPASAQPPVLDIEDRKLMTAVVNRAEQAGKAIKPIVLLSDDPEQTIARAAGAIDADELILSPCPGQAPDVQLDRVVAWRCETKHGRSGQLTVRMIGKDLDKRREIAGGCQAPPGPDDHGETARSLAKAVEY